MAWMSDEQYFLKQDTIDKKITARRARHTITHNGKGGAVKFPSDFMSAKELRAMNGKCETYRMNSPITWDEFKTWPDEHKVTYVKLLRAKYNVPDNALAEMFGVCAPVLCKYFKCWGLSEGRGAASSKRTWDKEGFLAWRNGVKGNAVKASETLIEEAVVDPDETPVEEAIENPDETSVEEVVGLTEEEAEYIANDIALCAEVSEPKEENTHESNDNPGPIAFTGHCMPVIPKNGTMTFENNRADDALDTIKCLLSNVRVNLTISWECVFEEDDTYNTRP